MQGSLSSLLYGKISAASARLGGGWSERLTTRWESAFAKGIATGMAFLHLHSAPERKLYRVGPNCGPTLGL
jgi:hypothetical protein